jgi:hypothetical protein
MERELRDTSALGRCRHLASVMVTYIGTRSVRFFVERVARVNVAFWRAYDDRFAFAA